jgi:16S rRNA (adenine1518-N6/adenine1519-N6)-dimethyltransferase
VLISLQIQDLGQHFLIDDQLLNVMVELADVSSKDHVLEIGPGPGTLTQVLMETGAKVTAIELDDGPVLHLDNVFSEQQNSGVLTLLHGDALVEEWPQSITKIVANIPYQISSPLIEKITKFNATERNISRFCGPHGSTRVCSAFDNATSERCWFTRYDRGSGLER